MRLASRVAERDRQVSHVVSAPITQGELPVYFRRPAGQEDY